MNKKPINELTEEELSSLISESEVKVVEEIPINNVILESFDNILPFISTFNIKNGDNEVDSMLLYSLYKHWSKLDDLQLKGKFINELNKYFQFLSRSGRKYYLLDKSGLLFAPSIYELYEKKCKRKRTLPKGSTNHFNSFINTYQIKRSDSRWISFETLYFLYIGWRNIKKLKQKLKEKMFKRFLTLYFGKAKHTKEGLFYKIELTHEET